MSFTGRRKRLQMSPDGKYLTTFKNINKVSVATEEGIKEKEGGNQPCKPGSNIMKELFYLYLEAIRVKSGGRMT